MFSLQHFVYLSLVANIATARTIPPIKSSLLCAFNQFVPVLRTRQMAAASNIFFLWQECQVRCREAECH
jgi:hypothetical protein